MPRGTYGHHMYSVICKYSMHNCLCFQQEKLLMTESYDYRSFCQYRPKIEGMKVEAESKGKL